MWIKQFPHIQIRNLQDISVLHLQWGETFLIRGNFCTWFRQVQLQENIKFIQ